MATDTEKIIVQIKVVGQKDLQNLDTKTKQATKSASSLTSEFSKLTGGLIAATTAYRQMVKIISSAIKTFTKFEFEMAKVRAITGATDKDFKKLTATAQQLGRTTFFTASQVAELQVNFGKLGFSTQEILDAQEATLLLATATQSDLGRAAIVAGAAVRGFALDAAETARVVDVMAVAFTSSALDIEKFQTSMTKVAPISAAANITLESTTAVMGTLTDAGIEASIAGTSLRNIFLKMQDPASDLSKHLGFTVNSSEDLEKALKKLNSESLSNAEMMELVDLRQVAAFATMVNGTDRILSLTDAFEDSTDAAKNMADIMADTLQGDILKAKSAYEGFEIAILKGNNNISRTLRGLTNSFTQFLNTVVDNWRSTEDIAQDFVKDALDNVKEIQKEIDDLQKGGAPVETKERSELLQLEIDKRKDVLIAISNTLPALMDEAESYGLTGAAAREMLENQIQKYEALEIAIADLEEIKKTEAENEIQRDKRLELEREIQLEKNRRANEKKFDEKKKDLQELYIEELNLLKQQLIEEQITKDEYDELAFAKEQLHLANMLGLYQMYGESTAKIQAQILDSELARIKKVAKEENKSRKDQIDDIDDLGDALVQLAGENENLNKVREAGVAITQAAAAAESILRIQEILSEITKGKLTVATILGTKAKVANTTATTAETVATGANTVATTANTVVETASIAPKVASGAAGQTKLPFPLNIIAVVATLALLSRIIKSFGDGGVVEEYAHGGMVHGKSHAQGGEKFAVGGRVVELEGGEAVINKRSTAMFRNQLSAMNAAGGGVKFADGGLMNMPSFAQSQFNATSQAGMMGAIGQGSKVVVVESDISQVQNTVSVIEAEATF